jgi:hypothetical protein
MARQTGTLMKENLAPLALLLPILLGDEISRYGGLAEEWGVALGDVSDLASVMWPGQNFWHTEYHKVVPDLLRPAILAQHPKLSEITPKNIYFVGYRAWLAEQVAIYGEYLALRPVNDNPPVSSHHLTIKAIEFSERSVFWPDQLRDNITNPAPVRRMF